MTSAAATKTAKMRTNLERVDFKAVCINNTTIGAIKAPTQRTMPNGWSKILGALLWIKKYDDIAQASYKLKKINFFIIITPYPNRFLSMK